MGLDGRNSQVKDESGEAECGLWNGVGVKTPTEQEGSG